MHRYQPKIYVVPVPEEWRGSSGLKFSLPEVKDSPCFTFPETSFITVTAYQNQQVLLARVKQK